MEDQLVCPICIRSYELPRRYMIREDDINFLIIPKLLDCLHTCCQSCLEEIWEKNNCEGIICPQCNHYQNLRSVKDLPLDGTAISQLIPLDGASLSFCSRCRDEVPSFSWCETCCTTLCEFHHQDHKLSADTAKHSILTFKVISQEKLTIKPRMPSITCPEEIEQDATLYCHDCNLLLSAQAMLTKHSSHKCSESLSLFNWANDLIKYTISSTIERQNGLIKAIRGIKSNIDELQRNREIAEEEIRKIFDDIRRTLDERERRMLERLESIASRKYSILESQLEEMSISLENCRHTIFVAESLLKKTDQIEGKEPYIVSSAYTISRRGEEIEDEIISIPFEAQTHPFVRSYFIEQEIVALKTILTSIGGLLTHDNIPEDKFHQTIQEKEMKNETKDHYVDNKNDFKKENDHNGNGNDNDNNNDNNIDIDSNIDNDSDHDSDDKNNNHNNYYDSDNKNDNSRKEDKIEKIDDKIIYKNINLQSNYQISFTIQTRNPPKLSIENQQATSKEAVIIEARLKMIDNNNDVNNYDHKNRKNSNKNKNNKNNLIDNKSVNNNDEIQDYVTTPDTLNIANRIYNKSTISNPSTDNSLDNLLGKVVGEVVFLTEIDNRIMNKHLVRSNYDSFINDKTKLPTLRVTREIMLGNK